jgi:hypothetical protein
MNANIHEWPQMEKQAGGQDQEIDSCSFVLIRGWNPFFNCWL